MSFLKKMVKEFLDDDDKKDKEKQKEDKKDKEDHRDGKIFFNCLPLYALTLLSRYTSQLLILATSVHSYDNAAHNAYGHPPPQGPPAPYGAPPPMPPGWLAQWDQTNNRWYYVEQASGRSQWDPPAFSPSPAGPYAPPPMHGYGQGGYGGPNQYGGAFGHDERGLFGDHSHHGDEKHKDYKEKKDKGHSSMFAAGAGGLAVGAIGGAVIAHEMSE
jgi:hypothetical protein